jgi:hypothetical protein
MYHDDLWKGKSDKQIMIFLMKCDSILDLTGLYPDHKGIVTLSKSDPVLELILEVPRVYFHTKCWAWIR